MTETEIPEEEVEEGSALRILTKGNWFLLSNSAECRLVQPGKIAIFQVSGNYTSVTLIDGSKITFRGTLGRIQKNLDGTTFFQTSRDTIVNLEAVTKVRYFDQKRLAFKMVNDTEIILSRLQSLRLKKQFSL